MESKKKITIILIIVVAIAVIAGIGVYIYYQPVIKSRAAVNKTMSALRSGDFTSAKAHIDSDALKKDSDLLDLGSSDLTKAETKQLEKAMLGSLSYKVISAKRKNSTTVVVKTEIKNVNMKTAVDDWYAYVLEMALKYAFSDSSSVDAKIQAEAVNSFSDAVKQVKKNNDYKTATVDITVSKDKKGNWVIAGNDKLYDAILGGMVEAVNDLSNK